jgi:MFS family permease
MTLLALCLAYFMVILDATIVNPALPTLAAEMHAGVAALQWVVDGYTLTFAAFLLLGGALGDRVGARRTFLVGLALFAAASLACGLSPSVGALVAARVAQGLSAALARRRRWRCCASASMTPRSVPARSAVGRDGRHRRGHRLDLGGVLTSGVGGAPCS